MWQTLDCPSIRSKPWATPPLATALPLRPLLLPPAWPCHSPFWRHLGILALLTCTTHDAHNEKQETSNPFAKQQLPNKNPSTQQETTAAANDRVARVVESAPWWLGALVAPLAHHPSQHHPRPRAWQNGGSRPSSAHRCLGTYTKCAKKRACWNWLPPKKTKNLRSEQKWARRKQSNKNMAFEKKMVTAPTWNMGSPQPQRDPIQTKFRVCSSSTASFGSFGASDAAPHGPTGKGYELPFRERTLQSRL